MLDESSLHLPVHPTGASLVLTHGAGGNAKMPLLVAVADRLAAAGLAVIRYNLPFRQKRPQGPPPSGGGAADRKGLRDTAALLRKRFGGPVYGGGQSYGGRQASMLAAEDPACFAGLLLLSYPLHPPGKPETGRTGHFESIRCPSLWIHGATDPFGTFEELTAAVAPVPGKTKIMDIPKVGHDLGRGNFNLQALLVEPFLEIIA